MPRSRAQRMQQETANKSQDGQNTSCISQPEGLRRAPFNASDVAAAEEVNCIANNMEKYITLSLGGLRFIDGLNFLQGSLDSLVRATPKEALKITSAISKGSELLYKKGIYPYEYIDSWERFTETRLPDKENF